MTSTSISDGITATEIDEMKPDLLPFQKEALKTFMTGRGVFVTMRVRRPEKLYPDARYRK